MVNKHLFTPADLPGILQLNALSITQSGLMVAVVTTRRNSERNIAEDTINVMKTWGDALTPFAGSGPQFSPDERFLAFVNDGGLWVMELATQTIRKIADIHTPEYFMGHMAEENFAWSPDSKSLAYISSEPLTPNTGAQRVISRLMYKSKGGHGRNFFADTSPVHIWMVGLNNAAPTCLTPGHFNEHSISWSPDGNFIAFISNRSDDPDRTHANDVLKVNVQTGAIEVLVSGKGTRFKPQWSPDGTCLAFLADESNFTSKDSPAPDVQVFVFDVKENNIRCLTQTTNRRTDNIKWFGVNTICFTAGNHGSTRLYSVPANGGPIKTLLQEPQLIKDYVINQSAEKIIYVGNTPDSPDEVFVANIGDLQSSQLTSYNDKARKQYYFASAESFWFNSDDGTSVQGWLMKPANFLPNEKYPLILVIHGGPHNMFGFEFDERMQVLTAAGYGVVYINPRGSTGYGQAFTNGNLMNWGGKDYEDVIAGVNHIITHHPWVDKDRLGVTGQSYGGFLTNWIITQTNMFKAAVSDGGISNLISFAGTSLYHCLIEAEFGGDIYDNYDLLWKWSPLKYVKAVTTPTLFLHGDTDNEVPVTQAEEMFSALKRLGVDSEFVRYLNEGHGWRPDLLPANRIDLLERMIVWFNRYLNKTSHE